jgi:hypothetical protein
VGTGTGIEQLQRNAHHIVSTPHASLNDVTGSKLLADLTHVDSFPL